MTIIKNKGYTKVLGVNCTKNTLLSCGMDNGIKKGGQGSPLH
jgi:hypothetical protein